jgi:hypothetical protein
MNLRFRIELNINMLYNGHRSVFAVLQFGRRTFFAQRWDTARAPKNRLLNADGSMGWTWGLH